MWRVNPALERDETRFVCGLVRGLDVSPNTVYSNSHIKKNATNYRAVQKSRQIDVCKEANARCQGTPGFDDAFTRNFRDYFRSLEINPERTVHLV
jgi:hypothetical protein